MKPSDSKAATAARQRKSRAKRGIGGKKALAAALKIPEPPPPKIEPVIGPAMITVTVPPEQPPLIFTEHKIVHGQFVTERTVVPQKPRAPAAAVQAPKPVPVPASMKAGHGEGDPSVKRVLIIRDGRRVWALPSEAAGARHAILDVSSNAFGLFRDNASDRQSASVDMFGWPTDSI